MKSVWVLIISLLLVSAAKLPPHFGKCDRNQPDFQTCLPKAVQISMSSLNSPISELGLPSLNPLEVPAITIAAGTKAVGLQQNFKNVRIYGINKLSCSRMDVDFKNKVMDNECFYPELRLETDYDISGKILLLDIYGKGPGVVTLSNVTITVHYNVEEYEKNGRKHFTINKIDLKLTPQHVQFRFENLFNGDKTLSDNVHQVINENWQEVYEDVSQSYNEVFGKITKNIFNSLLKKVALDDLFGKE